MNLTRWGAHTWHAQTEAIVFVAIDCNGFVIGMGETREEAAREPAEYEGFGTDETAAHTWLALNRGATWPASDAVVREVREDGDVKVRIDGNGVAQLACRYPRGCVDAACPQHGNG